MSGGTVTALQTATIALGRLFLEAREQLDRATYDEWLQVLAARLTREIASRVDWERL